MFWRRRRKALSSYKTVLARRLRAMHGARAHYNVEDVLWAIRMNRLDDRYASFALAMYCSREDFEQHHAVRGQSYDRLRRKVRDVVPVPVRAAAVAAPAGYAPDEVEEIEGDDDREDGWDALDLVADVACDALDSVDTSAITDAVSSIFDAIDFPNVD